MRRLLALMAWLSVPGAIAFYLFSCGTFSPGGIPGNTRYPEMALRAEKALKYAERKGTAWWARKREIFSCGRIVMRVEDPRRF
jgi:hypothetical protein